MKRLANKSLALLLALLLAVSTMSGLTMAAEEDNAGGINPLASSGNCGTGVTWVLDDDGTLTISGDGAMSNYSYATSVPWYGSRGSILAVVIEEGVTSIGESAFYDCWNMTSVSIASTVTSIGSQAFYSWGDLTIVITFAGDAPTSISSDAFRGAVVTAYYPSGNSTWTSSVKQNYGGTITWKEYDLPESADKTELKAAIDAAEALDQSDYTTESWSALEEALTEARSVYSNASATEEEVKQAADNLNAAIENLVKGAEKADLKAAIEKAEDLNEAMYTSDSWAVLQKALEEAIAVRDNGDASQDEVDLAAKNLESAIDALEPLDNQCGPNLTWALDEEGNLTITGTGTMYDYDPATNPAPWTGMNVVTLTIEEGATSIGTYAFTGLTTLTYADITDTVISVGDYAFAGDSSLEYIVFSGDNGTAPTIAENSFSEVTAVAYYPDNSAWKEVIGSNYGGTITWVEYMVGMHAHEFQFYWYPSDGGYTRFKVCLFDENGNAISGHNTSAQFTNGVHDDGDSTSYTFSIADFVDSYVVIDEAGYNFSYATVSDPNITDTEHEHYEGMQAQYGSSIDPVERIKLHWTKDAAATSKTWNYTMYCRNGNEYTVGIYGNQDGASDGYAWSPYSLELNLYFEEETIPVDKSALEEAITAAENLTESDYTPSSWSEMTAVLADALKVYNDEDASQTEVDDAADALTEAIGKLVERADKEALEAAIADAAVLNEADYTSGSWAALDEALQAAEKIDADPDVSQTDVNSATDALTAAINGLVDITELKTAIEQADALEKDDYSEASWNALQTVLADAKLMLENSTATQDQVDAAVASLASAVSALVDESALKAEIEEAKSMDESLYTTESWQNLVEALNKAESVLENGSATQQDVSDALQALQEAITNLVFSAHTHDFVPEVTDPTCTKAGYTTYTCSICHESYIDDYTDALGHDWNDGEVTQAPTCTADGVMTYTCKRCETTRTEIIANTGHDYAATEVIAPTCTEAGYTTYTCSNCGASYKSDYEGALGHAWDDGVVTTEPTCTAEGVMTYTCTRCDATRTEPVAKTDHDFTVSGVKAATCTEAGYTTYTCSVCKAEYTSDYTSALGHNWGEGVVTTEPTCTAEGVMTYTCTRCDATRTEVIDKTAHNYIKYYEVSATCTDAGYATYRCTECGAEYTSDYTNALGHAWNNGEVTKEPTCIAEGEMTYTCTRCSATRTESIVKADHNYVAGDPTPATCTDEGYTTYTCSVCGDSYKSNYTDALGHAWDEGVVTTEPTCTAEGVMTYTCTRCGATSTAAIARTAHDYVGVVTDPTCTAAGYTTYTCSVCGDTYVSDYTNALGHQWDDGVVTKEPTDTEEGEITYTCTVCGATYTEAIPPTGSEGSNPDSGTEGPGPAVTTGFVQEDGEWHYYDVNGNQVMNGILQDTNKVVDGTDGWFYVVNGKIDFSYTGVSNFANDYGWWYINAGKVDFSKTGIEQNQYGWWRVVNAKVDFSCNSVEQNDYGWWYVVGGQVQFGYTGVANYANAYGWWYIKNGQVDFSKTGIEQNNYGWWRVVNGKVDFSCNSVEQNDYGWWYVTGGQVQFNYTGVANYANAYGWWYIKNGQVDFSYTGTASNNYGTWNVVDGKVVF